MNDVTKRKYRLPLNLQMFAEGDPEPTPNPDPTPPEPKTVTMTQDELDALIGREKAKAKKPYADYDELKTKLAGLESAEAERTKAAMTEAERLQAELADERRKREESESKTSGRLIKSEFRALAKESGIRADAIEDAFKLADMTSVKVSDEGDVEGVADVIKTLLESKPYLAETAKPAPRPIGGPAGGDPKPEKTKEKRLSEAADRARKSGRLEDKVAYASLKAELNK
ncbi:scaffolding protein [Paenibacillus sp. PAMC21692]|uniref:phage scaffolding protein n=1 Tax=Paenibacillus sp. PAMC21692 TaxID=2762320 RepID=UPI00164DE381|nr:scaffolding protein [Paenibacillus sp. PAMC21692]QNK54558.1 scaffolding protein [Paenibacillus sp. PAMC21692]